MFFTQVVGNGFHVTDRECAAVQAIELDERQADAVQEDTVLVNLRTFDEEVEEGVQRLAAQRLRQRFAYMFPPITLAPMKRL